MEFNYEQLPSRDRQHVLICQRNDCQRGVYLKLVPGEQSARMPSWWCYGGHQQNPGQLTYADEREIDRTLPVQPIPRDAHPTLDQAWEAIEDFCTQIGADQDDLDAADWQRFEGDKEPNWMDVKPCNERPALWGKDRSGYECYHVLIGGHRAFFFWISSDLALATLPGGYFWEADSGESRNGRIFIARNALGEIIGQMTGTRPGGMVGSLATALSYLRLERRAARVEIHANTFDWNDTYERKPLGLVTLDDLESNERMTRDEE